MVRRCVCSRDLVNEETLAHWGLLHQKQTKKQKTKKIMLGSHIASSQPYRFELLIRYQTTWIHISGDKSLHGHCSENALCRRNVTYQKWYSNFLTEVARLIRHSRCSEGFLCHDTLQESRLHLRHIFLEIQGDQKVSVHLMITVQKKKAKIL
jgi:hypothetical protein